MATTLMPVGLSIVLLRIANARTVQPSAIAVLDGKAGRSRHVDFVLTGFGNWHGLGRMALTA
jgi:hypothetical protein